MAASCRDAVLWSLSPGNAADGPQGRLLIEAMGIQKQLINLLMDCAYEGNATREIAKSNNFNPIVPAHPRRKQPWILDREKYRQRNEVERLFRRIKAYRRVFTRYDKLDLMFAAFISVGLICEHLR